VDSQGKKIAQGRDHQVGGEIYPTSLWAVGETLRDEHMVDLPKDIVAGHYHLQVGMYQSLDGEPFGEPSYIGSIELK
jgi:hypothetical protein